MSSYFSTIKRGGASSKKGSPPDDAALHELPPDEDQALSHLKEHAIPLMCKAKGICASSDAWMLLLENGRETERDEMLLRFLRYNGLNVEITVRQVGEVISWRTKVTISSMVVDVMYGKEAGIPIVQLGKITKQGDGLFFCAAELYEKKDVVRKTQEIGVIKMFEYLLYEMCIPRVKRVTAVIDFTGFGVKHIDLTALRMGISVYTNYYPDVFHRVFLVNYPKILYGVWKVIEPLLDCRTASRVIWVTDGDMLRTELEGSFKKEDIPTWMGGSGGEGEQMKLFSGRMVDQKQLEGRFS